MRVNFTSDADACLAINLIVSSESAYDFAFISQLDNPGSTSSSGFYSGSKISGEASIVITIPVTSAGAHFVDIAYTKDSGASAGSDCAWFSIIEAE